MRLKHPIRFLFILVFSTSCIVAGCFLQRTATPEYQIKRAIQNTFSSLNDTALSSYWTTSTLPENYQQNLVLSLKNISTKSLSHIPDNLRGIQLALSATTTTASGVSEGNYTLAYSAIPLVQGDFSLSEESALFTAPDFLDDSIHFSSKHAITSLKQSSLGQFFPKDYSSFDVNLINIPAVAMQIQPALHQLYAIFYTNHFEKASQNTTIKGENCDYSCSVYQMNLSDISSSSLENILTILSENPGMEIIPGSLAVHPELQPLRENCNVESAVIYLAIDKQHRIRQLQCHLSSPTHSYDYTLTLPAKDQPLSTYVLSFICTERSSKKVTSYCQLIKKESCTYYCYAQDSASSSVDYYTFDISREKGVIHESSKIDYTYHTIPSSIPSYEDILYGTSVTDTSSAILLCSGSLKYYMTMHPNESNWELNIESLSVEIPSYNTSFVIAARYTQQALRSDEK